MAKLSRDMNDKEPAGSRQPGKEANRKRSFAHTLVRRHPPPGAACSLSRGAAPPRRHRWGRTIAADPGSPGPGHPRCHLLCGAGPARPRPARGAPASRPGPAIVRPRRPRPPPPEGAPGRPVNAPNRPAGRDKARGRGPSRPRPRPGPRVPAPARPHARSPGRGAGATAAAAAGPALGRLPAGSPAAARAARSGAAARAPPPSASHPRAPLGPGPARSLAAEPSASAPGGAYKAARQLRPGCHWLPSPRPRAHWLRLTAPPLPSAGPINTARPALRAPRLGGRRRRPRLAIGPPAGTRRRPPTCPLTGSVLIGDGARQPRRPRPIRRRLGLGLTREPRGPPSVRTGASEYWLAE
nr:uncharacterized protein LOC111774138 [Equus caballus]